MTPRDKEQKAVRVRFAPSPTGALHMGGARTALFNYLFAKKQGGVFVLRVEDTDKERSRKEWEKDIVENLRWLGIDWNEGPDRDGPFGPYRQSERTQLYRSYLEKLLHERHAYYCFCKPEDLEAIRQEQASRGEAPHYPGTCRSLSQEEQEQRLKAGESAVIRFVIPQKVVSFHDLIRGKVEFDAALMGDTVIAKDLETPLYNFTVVVDDFEMKISHVIRGEDHISNTPRQMLIQEALGFPAPSYAHLPLLLGPDRTKLSKRHGDNSVGLFRKEGYLPEAIGNFLALLGWNPGTEQEVFSLEELVAEFSLERVQKGGAIFNVSRLDWLNGHYIREKSADELAQLAAPFLCEAGLLQEAGEEWKSAETGEGYSLEQLAQIGKLYRERLKRLAELPELTDFFFQKSPSLDKELLRWKDATHEETKQALSRGGEVADSIQDWREETISQAFMAEADKEKNRGYLLWPLRVALSGKKASAGPFEIAAVLGKEKTMLRIQEALTLFS